MLLLKNLAFQTQLIRLLGHVLEVDCNGWALEIINRFCSNHRILTLDCKCLFRVYIILRLVSLV